MMGGTDRSIALAIMAKAPIPGEVKTRLAATLGPASAVALYRALLLDSVAVLDAFATRSCTRHKLLVCPDERHALILRALVDHSWAVIAQTRAGLMGGIVDAFEAAFGRGADLTIVSDADSPQALSDYVGRCVDVGFAHDLALGPTDDGGYYLVTSQRKAQSSLASLFLGTRYESATIGAATAKRARLLDLSVGFGPCGADVDTRDDLNALARRLETAPATTLPNTRTALAFFRGSQPVAAGS
jgi:glycosyltransferase A (GT-A) superfamily protein (DUF2064 family)